MEGWGALLDVLSSLLWVAVGETTPLIIAGLHLSFLLTSLNLGKGRLLHSSTEGGRGVYPSP